MLYLKEVRQLLKKVTWSPFWNTLGFMVVSIIVIFLLGCISYFIIQGDLKIQDVKYL